MDISVVIPCYNYGQFIYEAIASVEQYNGRFKHEVIIVNDGSTDLLTIQILKRLEESGYKVINQQNQGLGAARNSGIEAARGKYILPLDADNKIRPDYIDDGIRILESHNDIGIVYGNAQKFGEENELWQIPDFNANLLLGEKNYIDACAVYRKEVWHSVGGYLTDMPVMGYEDWMFWLQAFAKNWKFYHVDKALFDYRVRSGSMITKIKNHNKYFQLYKYIVTKQLEVIKLINTDVVDRDTKGRLVQEKIEKFSLIQVYNDDFFSSARNVIYAMLNTSNRLKYLKDFLYWFKERLKNKAFK